MTTVETTELGDSVKPPGSSFKPLSGRRKVVNSTAEVAVVVAVVIALIPLVWLLVTLVAKGIGPILDPDWWVQSARYGGAANAIVGTVVQTLLATVISVPLGIMVAIYLVEYSDGTSFLARATTFMVDILSGVPSIVAALFVYAVWRTTLGLPRMGFLDAFVHAEDVLS